MLARGEERPSSLRAPGDEDVIHALPLTFPPRHDDAFFVTGRAFFERQIAGGPEEIRPMAWRRRARRARHDECVQPIAGEQRAGGVNLRAAVFANRREEGEADMASSYSRLPQWL
jgi:hypothetical protein